MSLTIIIHCIASEEDRNISISVKLLARDQPDVVTYRIMKSDADAF